MSVNSIYNKLNGVETRVSRELVRGTAGRLGEVVCGWVRRGPPLSRAIA